MKSLSAQSMFVQVHLCYSWFLIRDILAFYFPINWMLASQRHLLYMVTILFSTPLTESANGWPVDGFKEGKINGESLRNGQLPDKSWLSQGLDPSHRLFQFSEAWRMVTWLSLDWLPLYTENDTSVCLCVCVCVNLASHETRRTGVLMWLSEVKLISI